MKHPRKVAAPPRKGEAHNRGNGAGPNSKQDQHKESSRQPRIGKVKASDSRTKVIERAKPITIGVPFHTTPPELAQQLMAIRDAHPGSTARVQEARLEEALRQWPLTTYEMLKFLDLYDPRARIQGLRLAGHNIPRAWVWIETDGGERHRVGRFTMQRGGTITPTHEQSELFDGSTSSTLAVGGSRP